MARPHPLRIDIAFSADHTLYELGSGHLQTEDRNRFAGAYADILGYIKRERCFTNRWTGCNDNQVAALKAGCHAVEIRKAGRNTGRASAI
ncbi:hypothetical protein D3C80_1582900 [compost metagenome]